MIWPPDGEKGLVAGDEEVCLCGDGGCDDDIVVGIGRKAWEGGGFDEGAKVCIAREKLWKRKSSSGNSLLELGSAEGGGEF